MKLKSLKKRENELANAKRQLEILSNGIFQDEELPTFRSKLKTLNLFPLQPKILEILQINVGYMCNQVCAHCHVDAGPDRKEIMTRETMQQCLDVIKDTGAHTLDLTGGAPEMNPHFRWFVEEATKVGVKDVIVRSNLTIITANKNTTIYLSFSKNIRYMSYPLCHTGRKEKQINNVAMVFSMPPLKP